MLTTVLRVPLLYGCVALVGCALALPAAAQHRHAGPRFTVGGGAIGILTHVAPGMAGEDLTEAYLTQPVITTHGQFAGGMLQLTASLNLEGLTLRRGELNHGVWGEGYVDRRHPHTYLHEALLTIQARAGAVDASLTAGKGFAPFGTDDPMMRSFVKYPANHHLAQVLERLVLIAAARRGPVLVEAALFNGDEPAGVRHNGTLDRFGDSWAARMTLRPAAGLELQASHALLESPEIPMGGGLDHRKWSAAARFERALGAAEWYGLLEYARTGALRSGSEVFVFYSVLGEAAVGLRNWQLALRYEETVRPEEERLLDPFRARRPPTDNSILGRTRWRTMSAQVARELTRGPLEVTPLLELARAHAEPLARPAVFEPETLYGEDVLWTFSIGLRLGLGALHQRMGRYGAARIEN